MLPLARRRIAIAARNVLIRRNTSQLSPNVIRPYLPCPITSSIFQNRGLVRFSTTVENADTKVPSAAPAASEGNGEQASMISSAAPAASEGNGEHASKISSAPAASSEGNEEQGSGQSDESKKPVRGGPVSWLSLLLLMITGGGIIVYYDKEKKRHIEELKNATSTMKQGPSVGKAAIGGPFKLVDHNGKEVTQNSFIGKWTLIYFGFTHCPDICPDELQKMVAAVDKIKAKAGIEIVPVFISVDPERDTVEQIHDYIKEFHQGLIGLTGTPDEVRQVARAYRVYYMKTEEEGSDYLVDHSIVMYLMDPKMEFVKFFGKNYDVETLTEGIIQEIKGHR